MLGQVATEANRIEDAQYVSFDVDHLTGITKGKLYEVKFGRPIGIDDINSDYADEHYIVNDSGDRMHGVWAFYKAKFYK